MAASLRLLRHNHMLRRFLMFTVLMNFFYYAFVPLVPVFAEDLEVGPFLTGLLAAAIGAGGCGKFFHGIKLIQILHRAKLGAFLHAIAHHQIFGKASQFSA